MTTSPPSSPLLSSVPHSHHTVTLEGLKVHYVEAGSGPPVLLLHGFPETWYCWKHQIRALSPHYRLIVPDLRGYGLTGKPQSGYDKRSMALDVIRLLDHLHLSSPLPVIGHDRGARVATRLVKDHPQRVSRLCLMDNIPTRLIFQRMDATIAKGHWWFLFGQVLDVPEWLIEGREERFLRYIFSTWTYSGSLDEDTVEEYTRMYSQPGAWRGAFNDYRAAPEDVKQDEEDAERLIEHPLLVLWGKEFASGGQMWDFREVWHTMANNVRFCEVEQCGHLPHEERPDVVNAALMDFLAEGKS